MGTAIKKEVSIFIASSIAEFSRERTELLAHLDRLNKYYRKRGVLLEWNAPESMSHAMREGGSQAEIDGEIRDCAFFFLIAGGKVGDYTRCEFETAWEQYQKTGKPKVVPYFLLPPYQFYDRSVESFRDRLKELKHYYKMCRSMEEIQMEMHLELLQGGAFDTGEGPSDREAAARNGLDGVREMIGELREKIEGLEEQETTPQTVLELTNAYEELTRLVQEYKVEPDVLIEYMRFLWKQHMYDRGIEVGHWLEGFYKMEDPGEKTWSRLKTDLGLCYHDSSRHEQAERYYREALNIDRRLAQYNPADFETYFAMSCVNLATLLNDTNRLEEAESRFREALGLFRRLTEDNPASYAEYLAWSCNNLANLLYDANRNEEAEKNYREALEISRRLVENNPAAYEPDLALYCNNLACLLDDTNRKEEAEKYYREAMEVRRRLAKSNPAAYEPDLAQTCYNMGLLAWRYRNIARRYFTEALSLYEKFPHCKKEVQDCRRLLDRVRPGIRRRRRRKRHRIPRLRY